MGAVVARRLLEGIAGLKLAAISVRDEAKARAKLPQFSGAFVTPENLADHADVVVECLPPPLFSATAFSAINAGAIFVPLSVAQLLQHWELTDTAAAKGARIVVPTGALLGLDAVRAAAEGHIERVTMTTRKPPNGLNGAPYLKEHGIEIDDLRAPLRVYRGSVRAAATGFPANLNVAAALSLAGIGPDRTMLEVFADPFATRNIHTIEVVADSANFTMSIENVPSQENPRTGRLTALSTIATQRSLVTPLKIGT